MAYVLHRGMYDQPRDKVTPSMPSVLPPMTIVCLRFGGRDYRLNARLQPLRREMEHHRRRAHELGTQLEAYRRTPPRPTTGP